MRRSWVGCLAALAGAITIAAAVGHLVRGADAPFAGTWKVTDLGGPMEDTLCLVKVEGAGGRQQGKVIWASPDFEVDTVEGLVAGEGSLRFTVKGGAAFPVVAYVPKGPDDPKVLRGSFLYHGRFRPLQLEKTGAKKLAREEARKINPGFGEMEEVLESEDAKVVEAGLKKIGEKYADKPVALPAADMLFQVKLEGDAPAAVIRECAGRRIRLAAAYGREMEMQAATDVAQALAARKRDGAVAYARQARKLLRDSDPPATQVAVLQVLVKALRKAGQADEAKEAGAQLAKVNDVLDREFLKRAVPFKPEPFAGRKAKGGRVAVVELFTGAQCPPCVGADVAFDAALETYKPGEVVFLEYHLHIPGPDPLANPGTVARAKYYDDEIEGTPTVLVDGKATESLGGPAEQGKENYETLRKQVERELEKEAGAALAVRVRRKGDRFEVQADVAGLKKTGPKVRLRLALVEEEARYAGGNGQRFHRHVVRALPGGAEGVALTEKSSRHSVRFALGELRTELRDYLRGYEFPRDKSRPFADEEDLPLELKHLKVVALVQDDDTKEILQAAQADVPESR